MLPAPAAGWPPRCLLINKAASSKAHRDLFCSCSAFRSHGGCSSAVDALQESSSAELGKAFTELSMAMDSNARF
eukprot:4852452-Amphidinium_carterae.1